MTNELASRPAPLSRVWSAGGKVIAENVEGEDLADVLKLHADAAAWWVMPRTHDDARLRQAATTLDIDRLALRDLLADDRRAKFEKLDKCTMVLTNAVTLDRSTVELTAEPISMLLTAEALICLVDRGTGGLDVARLLAGTSQQLVDGGAEHAMQLVLHQVITSYEEVVEWIEDRSDGLAEALFSEQPLNRTQQVQAFRVRTVLSQLRRVTDPMREVLSDLLDDRPDDAATRRWRLLEEQHHRVANAADALRETLSSVLDTSLALADLRMNVIMKQLTGWASIIAAPTLVTGFAGMNVNFPGDGTSAGFWLYAAIMVVSVVVLFVLFRRKDWI